MMKHLTAKQEAFCVNYFLTRNGTQSAKKAGYSLSFNVARVIANENLKKPAIIARLASLQAAALPQEAIAKAAVAAVGERLEILTAVARHKIETPISAGHIAQAVSEMNKMEHIYELGGNIRDVNVVFVIGRGYAKQPPQLEEGKAVERTGKG